MMDLYERFEKFNEEFIKFDRIKNKRSLKRDMHAFLLLEELFPESKERMVSAASHDVVYLGIEEDMLEKLTDDNIIELIRCGICYNIEYDCLYMFT